MSREERTDILFSTLGLAPRLLDRLDALGFKHPTPIQHQTIPLGIAGNDVIGIAQTGTGKTLAFALPMLQRIAQTKTHGLILLPTRELAVQVHETFQKIASPFGLRTAMVIGGASMYMQGKQLKERPHVIIATPGRLIDHVQKKNVHLNTIGILVLDEADRMLDMGFAPQINRILESVSTERQTMLFSATMPSAIADMANRYMKKPLRVEVSPQGTSASTIEQEIIFVSRAEKPALLGVVLKENKGSVLVFSRTKHGASKLAKTVRSFGITAAEIHSNRSQNQRQQALNGFADGRFRVLIATDIASRGIDVKNIALVVNYDLPDQIEDYVHRIGRTGRAGATGKAISFAAPDQRRDVVSIERLIQKSLPKKTIAPNSLPVPETVGDGTEQPKKPLNYRYRSGDRPQNHGQASAQQRHSSPPRQGRNNPRPPMQGRGFTQSQEKRVAWNNDDVFGAVGYDASQHQPSRPPRRPQNRHRPRNSRGGYGKRPFSKPSSLA